MHNPADKLKISYLPLFSYFSSFHSTYNLFLRRCKCILVVVFHLFIHKFYEFPLPSNHHPGFYPPSSSFSTLVTSQSSSTSFSSVSVCLYLCVWLFGIYHDEYDEEQVQHQKYFYLLSCFSFPSYCCWCFFVSLQVLYFYVLHSTLPKLYSMLYGFFLQDSFYLYHHITIVIIIMITPPSSLSSIKSTWLFLLLQSTKKKPWLCLLCLMSKSSSSSSWSFSFIFMAFLSLSLSFFKTNNKRTAHYLQQKIRLLFLLLFLIIFSSSLTLVLFSKFALSLLKDCESVG